ncbi:MAG: response regulator [Gammaproteobacteria bacterium]|nr:response regulator [Gammaproteobacteria bacterium]
MKRTVLVVDDEANMQTVMRMVLEGAGHDVLVADSGEAALVHAQNPNLDVVLTDLRSRSSLSSSKSRCTTPSSCAISCVKTSGSRPR